MYYSATTAADSATHCIGAAKASTVTGPFTPVSSIPLICPHLRGGAIDASGYSDNGKRYITYKNDGNSLGHGGACDSKVELAEERMTRADVVVSQIWCLRT